VASVAGGTEWDEDEVVEEDQMGVVGVLWKVRRDEILADRLTGAASRSVLGLPLECLFASVEVPSSENIACCSGARSRALFEIISVTSGILKNSLTGVTTFLVTQ
jgi:hypothetical protein